MKSNNNKKQKNFENVFLPFYQFLQHKNIKTLKNLLILHLAISNKKTTTRQTTTTWILYTNGNKLFIPFFAIPG